MDSGYTKSGYYVAVYTNGNGKYYCMDFQVNANGNILAESRMCPPSWYVQSINLCRTQKDARALREYWDVSFFRNGSYLCPSGDIPYPPYLTKQKREDLLKGA